MPKYFKNEINRWFNNKEFKIKELNHIYFDDTLIHI